MRAPLLFAALAAAALLAGCRTTLKPVRAGPPRVVYVGDKTCNVYDFPNATDVPDGSKNLGWVEMKSNGNDEETFVKLREKICELGGDGLSQAAWVREATEAEPSILKANAWLLP